ncbi:MAG: FtsW/RodA/SpoVE family cell cycle protein, partial [Anaerolineae bacterium]|nr:FtsW/RodA/SpoVE family cell cycle protein [Anaerolineae bacterium]NIQ80541.1 FtsW/RodA/SpoVE family cell cycle protein [Anaerolineae bacterium]
MTALLNRVREIAVPKRDNRSDWLLFGSVAALSVIGVLMIFSATRATGSFSMERQLIFVTAGLIVLAIISNIDYREYRAMVPAAAAVITALLILVLFMPEIENVNRWIP